MKFYFATPNADGIQLLLDEKCSDILVSYAFFKKGLPDNLLKAKDRVNLMLDSGGHTNKTKLNYCTFEGYTEFLKEYKDHVDEYIVLDDYHKRENTIKNFNKMRGMGLNPLYVDHLIYRWDPRLNPIYTKENKLCWGGIAQASMATPVAKASGYWDQKTKRLLERFKAAGSSPSTQVHLLGVGQALRKFLPYFPVVDSIDSAVWRVATGQYGRWAKFYPPGSFNNKLPAIRFFLPPWNKQGAPRPPKEVYQTAEQGGLKLNNHNDRLRMGIREMKKFLAAMYKFFQNEKDKSPEHLHELSLHKDAEYIYEPLPEIFQVQWQSGQGDGELIVQDADTAESARVVTDGIVVSPYSVAEALADGASEMLVKSQPFAAEDKDYFLMSQNKTLGVMRLGEMVEISKEEFGALELSHLITEETRKNWSNIQPSWDSENLYAWPVEVVEKYIEPFETASNATPDAVVTEVTVKFDREYTARDLITAVFKTAHDNLHKLYATKNHPCTEEVVNLHARLVDTLRDEYSVEHPAPPANGLDDLSFGFERIEKSEKAVWSRAYINTLPDSAFLYVESGGKKDEEGKTVPRSLRHFPYKDATGKVDLPHLRNAIARIPQSKLGLSAERLSALQDKARRMLEEEKPEEKVEKNKTIAALLVEAGPPNEWSGGVAGVLGKEGRKKVTALWNALSKQDKKKVYAAFEKMFDATDVMLDIEDEYGEIAKSWEWLGIEKADPYMQAPPEDRLYRYTIQQHWRGKSVHSDLRIERQRGRSLIGWTLNTQVPDVVKQPVVTLSEAQKWSKRMSEVSKVNWNTGEWNSQQVLSEKKAAMPWAWIDVEGKTNNPEPGEPPPVGGTAQYPGVFDIVDQGQIEYGAQKSHFHEYFLNDGQRYRMFFRQLELTKSGEEKCSGCEEEAEFDVNLDSNRAYAPSSFCQTCLDEFTTKTEIPLPVEKRTAWMAIYPQDQTPYVLGNAAVHKGWMPPAGFSALPEKIRKQIPTEYRYWDKSGEKAKAIRDDLVKAIKEEKIKVDVKSSTQKSAVTASDGLATDGKLNSHQANYVLQEQSWRDSDESKYILRVDAGRPNVIAIELDKDPLSNAEITAKVSNDHRRGSMEVEGDISPVHYLNPNKNTPSTIVIEDVGKARILSMENDLIKLQLSEGKLEGLYTLGNKAEAWTWTSAQDADVGYNEGIHLNMPHFHSVETVKAAGKELRLVTGIVLEPNEVDAHQDWEKAETIRETAHKFLADYNKQTKLGLMHSMFGDIGVELVESYISPVAHTVNNKPVKKGSWVMTVHVTDNAVWEKIKNKELTGFSIGGIATVRNK